MIRGHAINLLHIFDVPQKFKVMSLMVETIKRTTADQKRSCGYARAHLGVNELLNLWGIPTSPLLVWCCPLDSLYYEAHHFELLRYIKYM